MFEKKEINQEGFLKNVFLSQILDVLWCDGDVEFKKSHKMANKIMENLQESFYFLHKQN